MFYMGDTPLSYGAATIRSGAYRTEYRYTELTHTERRSGGRCPTCGKRRNRQRTFAATQNPFNKDPETGEPRSYGQIADVLRAKGGAWQPDFTCADHGSDSRGRADE